MNILFLGESRGPDTLVKEELGSCFRRSADK